MTPEHLALIAASRSALLTALCDSEKFHREHRAACLQLSRAAHHALSLTVTLERGSLAQQADYARLLECQMVSVRACQAALNTLTRMIRQ
ncbi:hypothetical protein [Erwinia persicina]|uniref:hypothetical protein n=1 Tax=Erwinia persicina TaxID=55211 RepID=UPI00177B4240|nr:hypothetical protein [Erwinia persicina]MBD8214408.1 hypothetical protein [Erwinia persicina]